MKRVDCHPLLQSANMTAPEWTCFSGFNTTFSTETHLKAHLVVLPEAQ